MDERDLGAGSPSGAVDLEGANLTRDPMADAPDFSAMSTAQFSNALGMDGWKWSQAFCQRHPEIPFDEMLGWFANAIMAGHDHAQGRGGPIPECCTTCGSDDELRFGVCFDCASKGEERAARRSVAQHLAKAAGNAAKGFWGSARYDLSWAWERLTRTGDYRRGGTFERDYPGCIQ